MLHIQKAEEMNKYARMIENYTKTGNHVFLNYAHWCGACQMFLPEWKLFQNNASKQGINVIMIESSGYDDLPHANRTLYHKLSNDGQMYFPMVFVYVNGVKHLYEGERSALALQRFYTQHAAPKAASKAALKAAPKAALKAALKAAPKAASKAAPKAASKAASKAAPKAPKVSSKVKVGPKKGGQKVITTEQLQKTIDMFMKKHFKSV